MRSSIIFVLLSPLTKVDIVHGRSVVLLDMRFFFISSPGNRIESKAKEKERAREPPPPRSGTKWQFEPEGEKKRARVLAEGEAVVVGSTIGSEGGRRTHSSVGAEGGGGERRIRVLLSSGRRKENGEQGREKAAEGIID